MLEMQCVSVGIHIIGDRMATRNLVEIKTVQTNGASYRIYERNRKVFISELIGSTLRRLRVTPNTATLLQAYPSPSMVADQCKMLIDDAQRVGSPDFYSVKVND